MPGVAKKVGAGVSAGVAGLLLITAMSGAVTTEEPTPAAAVVSTSPTPESTAAPTQTAESSSAEASATASSPGDAVTGAAIAAVEALPVKGRAPKTGYERAQFGTGWIDVNRNGCDTRNDMLRADLTDLTMSGSCKVLSGSLDDPYTGAKLEFVYGGASEVDIDHVVALGDAWQKGAQQWSFEKRVAFANDPLNLQPSDAGANRSKGDGDTATWLPPNKEYRCEYVATQAAVKTKYGLWVTAAEKDAMLRVLSSCADQELPDFGSQPTTASNTGGQKAPTATSTRKSSAATPTPKSGTSATKGLDPKFRTCGDANDAGFGPYYEATDPEYDWYQDRDKDGAVCES